jgi:PAS domain-containing protein
MIVKTNHFVDHLIIAGLAIAVVAVSMLWTSARRHANEWALTHADYKRPLVIESDTLPIVFLDTEGVIVDLSPAAERMLGWQDAVGHSASTLMPPAGGDKHQSALDRSRMLPGDSRLVRCEVPIHGELAKIFLLIIAYTVDDFSGYAAILWRPEQLHAQDFWE